MVGMRSTASQTPIPRAEWPLQIKALALLASATDQGIGDVIARLLGPVGGAAYKTWFLATFRRSCGCSERQSDLKAKYPLAGQLQ
jgi:hypothetical protein